MSIDSWGSADIVDWLTGHIASMDLVESTVVVPSGALSLLRGLGAFCAGRLALRLRLSLGQLLEDGINHSQFALFANGDQQLCVFVKTDRGRILFAQHLPAGLNRGRDVFDFVGFQVRTQLPKTALASTTGKKLYA